MKNVICNYCKEKVPEQKDCMPTWFGSYRGTELLDVICKPCLGEDVKKDKWRKGIK